MANLQDTVVIRRERYQKLMEDAQALAQIVFLADTRVSGEEFNDSAKEIIEEWRNSRYGSKKE